MRAILVTSSDAARFEIDLQRELDKIAAGNDSIHDVKFSTSAAGGRTQWSALVLAVEPADQGIDISLAEAAIAEAIPPEEFIEEIAPPPSGL